MSQNIFFLETDQSIANDIKNRVVSIAKEHAEKAVELLKIEFPVNVSVYPNASWAIPETGEGGYTPTKDWVQISVDLTGEKHSIEDVVGKNLPATIYHEMNHALRWNTVGYGETFLEGMISEGLATVFEKLTWKKTQPLWGNCTDEDAEKLMQIIRNQKQSLYEGYDHSKWFFGTTDEVPRWLGYTLGTYIVEKAMKDRSSVEEVVQLTGKTAKEVFEAGGVVI